MTIFTENHWGIFDRRKRYWFARLFLETLFWNNHLDEGIPDILDEGLTKELDLPYLAVMNRQERDTLWWHLLVAVCYQGVPATSPLLESSAIAVIEIAKELLFTEVEVAEDFFQEEEWDYKNPDQVEYWTRYRVMIESLCRELYDRDKGLRSPLVPEQRRAILLDIDRQKVNDLASAQLLELVQQFSAVDFDSERVEECFELFEEEHRTLLLECDRYCRFLAPPTPQEVFDLNDLDCWRDRFDNLEFLFTAQDDDYCRDDDNCPALLAVLRLNLGANYWSLLFQCLEEKPLSEISQLKRTFAATNLPITLSRLSDRRIALLQESALIGGWYLKKLPHSIAEWRSEQVRGKELFGV